MPGIFMPRIPMQRARRPKTPGVSKICLSGSEPASASILSRRVDLENPRGLLSPVSPRPSSLSHRPSLAFNPQFSTGIFVPHPRAFVPQTTNQEHTPITSKYAREYPFLANENRQNICSWKKDVKIFFTQKSLPVRFQSSNVQTCKRFNACSSNVPTPILPNTINNHKSPIANPRLCSSKRKFKKTNPNQILTPCIYSITFSIPPHIRLPGVTQPELNDIYIELFRNN